MTKNIIMIFPKDKITDMGNGYVTADTQLTAEELIQSILRYSMNEDKPIAVVKDGDKE